MNGIEIPKRICSIAGNRASCFLIQSLKAIHTFVPFDSGAFLLITLFEIRARLAILSGAGRFFKWVLLHRSWPVQVLDRRIRLGGQDSVPKLLGWEQLVMHNSAPLLRKWSGCFVGILHMEDFKKPPKTHGRPFLAITKSRVFYRNDGCAPCVFFAGVQWVACRLFGARRRTGMTA